jgi:hypothetical protein
MLVAAIVATCSVAQNVEQLQKQLDEMRVAMEKQARALDAQGKAIENLKSENAELKSEAGHAASGLETEINRLSERVGAGTNIRSCASQINLGGEFRYRAYVASIDSLQNEDHETFWGDARVRLNFMYDFGCDVTAFAELQSHWAFGETEDGPFWDWNTNQERNDCCVPGSVGMYQAWLEIRNLFCRCELSARVGRQEVVFGNQFQFGNADWYNGIVHDGLRVDWRASCWSLTALAFKLTTIDGDVNQHPSYFTAHDDDELYGLYFTLGSIKNTSIDVYWMYVNGHHGPGLVGGGFGGHNSGASDIGYGSFLYPLQNAYFHTFGARVGGCLPVLCGLDYNVEGAIQTGTTHDIVGEVDTNGYTVEAEVGLTLTKSSKFRVFGRGLYASGADSDSAAYLILYPNRHTYGDFRARYGLADLIPMTNVVALQLGAHFDPACNWTLGATALYAMTEEDFGGGIDDAYGEEIDIWAEYRYSDRVTIGAGVAFVIPEDSGQILWGVTDDTQLIGYLQARLVF